MKNFAYISVGLLASINLYAVLNQDFETDTLGFTSVYENATDSATPNITQVASGTGFLGVNSSPQGGSFHAEVAMVYEDGALTFAVQGDRVLWNDGPYSGGFVSGNGFSIDVFFDDPSAYVSNASVEDGFFFQPTLLNDGNIGAVNGGGFGARIIDTVGNGDSTDFVWRVGADGDAKGFSGVSTFLDIDVASSGWYTMSTIWETNPLPGPLPGSGDINQVNTLTRISTGSIVYSETIEDAVAAGQGGAIGAASIGNGDFDGGTQVGPFSTFGDLAIDNSTVIPEPSALALVFGVVGLSLALNRRRR